MPKSKFIESSGNVFEDLGFDKAEAKNLKFRSRLMNMLIRYIQSEGLTQKEAADRLGVTQPRISNLVHGKIDLFSIGMLLNMMEQAGFPIYKTIETDVSHFFKKYRGRHDHASSGKSAN